MLTEDYFIDCLTRLGISVDVQELPNLLKNFSTYFEERSTLSSPISSDDTLFRLSNYPVLSDNFQFFRQQNVTDKDALIDDANLLTAEIFDHTDLTFVQTAEVALDPFYGVYKLLTPIEDSNDYVVFRGFLFDQDSAMNDFLFKKNIQNPITEYTKGQIKIKAKSPLEIAEEYQKLQAQTGQNILQISCTRYSTGLIKGRRDDI